MATFLIYILKSAVCLAAFYLFYRLLLSKETFHRFNRIAILGILALSFLMPFCEVSVKRQTEAQQTILSLEQLLLLAGKVEETPAQTPKDGTLWIQIVLFAYLAGIVFFVVRNLYSLVRLYLLLRTGERRELEHKTILIIHENNALAPFSWLKYVVVSRKDLEENSREILIHELAHVRNRHSIDMLVSGICIFFQWFNPAAWLLKQELQNIHEYEADEMVIREGVDAKQYQLLIIKKAVGTRLYSMANSFNHSKLKKRITMMLKEKSNPWARMKCLYVLPLAAIAITAFARPEVSNELKEISELKVNDLTAIAVTNEVENEALSQQNDSSKVKSVKIINVVSAGSKLKADNVNVSVLNEPLVFIDGKEVSKTILNAIDASKIEAIEVLKDNSAIEKYGDKGKNGVIQVTLKKTDQQENPIEITGVGASFKKTNVHVVSMNKPLYIVDGKEVSEIDAIDASKIEAIEVLKDNSAIEKYGDKGKNGVIQVTLKKTDQQEEKTE